MIKIIICYLSKIDPTIIAGTIALFGLVWQSQHNSSTLKRQSAIEFIAKSRSEWLHETRELYALYSQHFSNMYFCVVNGAFEDEYHKLRNDYYYTNDLLKMLFNPISDVNIVSKMEFIQTELSKTHVLIVTSHTLRVADQEKIEYMKILVSTKNELDKLVSVYFKNEWEQVKRDINYIK